MYLFEIEYLNMINSRTFSLLDDRMEKVMMAKLRLCMSKRAAI